MSSQLEQERSVLDRAIVRLAALNDDQLPDTLPRLLPKALRLFRRVELRTSALQLIDQIAKRIALTSVHPIGIPTDELAVIYSECDVDAQFALLFIQQAVAEAENRMDVATDGFWLKVAAVVISGISKRSVKEQMNVLHVFMYALPAAIRIWRNHAEEQGSSEEIRNRVFGLNLNDQDLRFLLRFSLDVLLMPYGVPSKSRNEEVKESDVEVPFGHSISSYAMVTRNLFGNWNFKVLQNYKLNIISFLRSGAFTCDDIYPHIIVGMSDPIDDIVNSAEDVFKRLGKPTLDENEKIIVDLYELYLGNEFSRQVEKELERKEASISVKLRVLSELQKSKPAAKKSSLALKVLVDSVFVAKSPVKLKKAGIQYLLWVLNEGKRDDLVKVAPVFQTRLLKLLKDLSDANEEIDLRRLLFEPIAVLCCLCPGGIISNVQMALYLFNRFKLEPPSNISYLSQSLRILSDAYKNCSGSVMLSLKDMLMKIIEDDEEDLKDSASNAKALAFYWLNNIFSFTDCDIRLLCCKYYASDSRTVVRDAAYKGLVPNLRRKNDLVEIDPFPELDDFVSSALSQVSKEAESSHLLPSYLLEILKFSKKSLNFCTQKDIKLDSGLESYLSLLLMPFQQKNFLQGHSLSDLQFCASASILEVCLLDVKKASEFISIEWAKSYLASTNYEFRVNFSNIVGILSTTLSDSLFLQNSLSLLDALKHEEEKSSLDKSYLCGLIRCCGYLTLYNSERLKSDFIAELTDHFVYCLGETNPIVVSSSALALSSIFSMFGLLVLPRYTSLQTTARLLKVAKRQNEHNCSSNALDAMSVLFQSVASGRSLDSQESCIEFTISGLLEFMNTKDEEVSLSLGEVFGAICCIPKPDSDYFYLKFVILEKLIPENFSTFSKQNRRNIGLWLLAIITKVKDSIEKLGCADFVQDALCGLLADGKSLTQEVASKALAALYTYASVDQKLVLSKRFVLIPGKLSGNNADAEKDKSSNNNSEDNTNKFEIYSELLAVCQDLNQSGIVYYLLDLASTHTLWLSDRGIKYSGKTIESISTILGSRKSVLLPKLYRYLFHPVSFVKSTMNSIWKLLISDEKQTLDENFNYILEVLIESLESKSLRIRETSCLAITEFLKSFEAMRFLETFLKLWTSSFHLLDDVDSSVRLCALGFGQQLIKISEKLVKNSTSFDAEKSNFIDEFFTLILERGASHSAKEVQSVSLQCVLTLTKDGSAGLEKYLPKIIGLLLESIDASESQELSYAMNHAEALNTSKEHIENLKIMLAESSPLSKSIDNCLQVLKGNQVQDLTGKLTNSFRYGIGITGIYKAASVVRFLAGKYPQALSSCCKELLNASKTFLFHESKALRKVSASTLALLCSISDKKNLLTVLDSLFHNYLTSDSKNSEFTVGQICLEIVKSCRDRFDTYMEKIIPFSYIASCDFREDISSIWSDVWNEVSAGQRDIELYLSQILVQCKLIVAQGSYNMREVSASALSKLYKNAQSLEILTSNSCEQLEALIDGFGRADRTGKDRTYTALVEICKRCSVSVSPNKELLGRIMKSLIEDCSNHSNFIEGLQSLCQLLSVFTQLRSEYSASILAMIETGILKNLPLSSESKDQDLASGAIKDCVRLYECVEKIWPNHIDSADSAFQKENLDPLLSHCISGLFGNHPSVRLQALKSLSHIVSLLPQNYSSFDHALYDKAVNAILNMTEDMKNGSIRAAAFSALQIFLENQTNLFGNYVSSLKAKVLASENDSNPAVSMIVRKLKNLL